MTTSNSFGTRAQLAVGGRSFEIFRLDALEQRGLAVGRLPYSLKILLENLLRREDGRTVRGEEIDRQAALFECVQAKDLEAAAAHGELSARAETVRRRHSTAFTSTTKYPVSPKHVVGMPRCCSYVSETRLPMDWLIRAATASSRTVK